MYLRIDYKVGETDYTHYFNMKNGSPDMDGLKKFIERYAPEANMKIISLSMTNLKLFNW